MVPTLLQGAGLAFYFIPLTTLSLSAIPQSRLPAAAGLSTFVRIASGAMGASISTTLWDSRAVLHHAHLVESLQPGSAALASALATLQASGLSEPAALAQLTRLIEQQAHTRAADDIFLASAWLFLALIALIWMTRRPPPMTPVSVPAVKRP
jgi:DHA2 family multidrug resistance protein